MDIIFLSKSMLFRGTSPKEVEKMLQCLGTKQKSFTKGSVVYHAGDPVQAIGLVLSGSVNIESDDLWGNKSILNHIAAGQIFAETYACIPGEPLMVNVVAAEASEILFLNTDRLLQTCHTACPYHTKLIRNLLSVTAQKNLSLSQRILYTSSKSIRRRLVSYLSYQATKQGSFQFTIPFNRQQLADYLGVDRSALSNELGKMQKEGLLLVNKNSFYLKETAFGKHY